MDSYESSEHLTPEELAARWGKARGTLANWRSAGKGPGYTKIGKTILYPLKSVERFEQQNTVA